MPSIYQLIGELNHVRASFEKEALEKKELILRQLLNTDLKQPKALLDLHECLLFLSAYPHNARFYKNVNKLLGQTAERIRATIVKKKKEGVFEGTGIRGTHVKAGFSFELIQWLLHSYPGALKLDAIGAEPELVFNLLLPLLPSPLREYFYEGGYQQVTDWLSKQVSPDPGKQLIFIVTLFENAGMPLSIRNQHFDQLELCVDADLTVLPGRHQLQGTTGEVYFPTEGLLRKAAVLAILKEPLQQRVKLDGKKTEALISRMRLQLLCLYRETDPATYACENDLHLYNVGRGMEIALIGIDSEHRGPIDAYIGFMAFKNGRPYAYGGAWLLGRIAKIGINIFSSYRGGESAWFFAQLLRVYYQCYKPSCFVAEPYQVGRDNPEGIETGAFWFYYKLGFRPVRKVLQQLATAEYAGLTSGKKKKSSRKTLEQLVEDEMMLVCDPSFNGKTDYYDTEKLSAALSAHLRKQYNGNLQSFVAAGKSLLLKDTVLSEIISGRKKLLEQEKISLYLLAGGGIAHWTPEQKKALGQLIVEKVIGTDSAYAVLFAQHEAFNSLLLGLAGEI